MGLLSKLSSLGFKLGLTGLSTWVIREEGRKGLYKVGQLVEHGDDMTPRTKALKATGATANLTMAATMAPFIVDTWAHPERWTGRTAGLRTMALKGSLTGANAILLPLEIVSGAEEMAQAKLTAAAALKSGNMDAYIDAAGDHEGGRIKALLAATAVACTAYTIGGAGFAAAMAGGSYWAAAGAALAGLTWPLTLTLVGIVAAAALFSAYKKSQVEDALLKQEAGKDFLPGPRDELVSASDARLMLQASLKAETVPGLPGVILDHFGTSTLKQPEASASIIESMGFAPNSYTALKQLPDPVKPAEKSDAAAPPATKLAGTAKTIQAPSQTDGFNHISLGPMA